MFMGPQRKWLNDMAAKGYRLVRADKLEYEFEECEPGRYVYQIEYVGDKSFEHEKDYKEFLQNCGYKVFYKNINLDYSVGKLSWRPFAEKGGRISTNSTTYNKELLIIEKENDGRPFELHTTPADKIRLYQRLRNPWLLFAAIFMVPAALLQNLVLAALALLCLIPAVMAQVSIHKCRKGAEGTDAGGEISESRFIKIFLPAVLILTAAAFILGITGTIKPSTNYRSGIFFGMSENHYKGVLNIHYTKANGTIVRTLSPGKGADEIRGSVATSSGTMSLTAETANGEILLSYPEGSINESITLPTSGGKVIIRLSFSDCRGGIDLEYK